MNDETFGQTLRRLRQEAGHSQRWLAEQVEIDHTYLSKIENGRVEPPSYKTINKIARALGTNMDVLAALAGPIANLHFRVAKSEQEIRNWTETARQYATNSVYWEKRALHAEGLVKSLIGAMERWGADEDGIPEEACDIVAEAQRLVERKTSYVGYPRLK